MIRRPPRSTRVRSSAASDVYKRQGNDLLAELTQNGRYKLRFDLQGRDGVWYYAEYSTFIVKNETYN